MTSRELINAKGITQLKAPFQADNEAAVVSLVGKANALIWQPDRDQCGGISY